MKLYNNDEYREEFMELVYGLLHSDGTNDRANQIIDAFDSAPVVEAEPLPPNAPLTLEELLELDGEPVWCECKDSPKCNGWYLVNASGRTTQIVRNKKYNASKSVFGSGFWIAYRCKPKEDGHGMD